MRKKRFYLLIFGQKDGSLDNWLRESRSKRSCETRKKREIRAVQIGHFNTRLSLHWHHLGKRQILLMNVLFRECKPTFKGIIPTFSYSPKFPWFFVLSDKHSWLLFCFPGGPPQLPPRCPVRPVPVQVQWCRGWEHLYCISPRDPHVQDPASNSDHLPEARTLLPLRPTKSPGPSRHLLLAPARLAFHTISRRTFGRDRFLFPFPTVPLGRATSLGTLDVSRERWELPGCSAPPRVPQLRSFDAVTFLFPFPLCHSRCFLLVFLLSA